MFSTIEKDFGLSNYTHASWFKDQAVALVVNLVLMLFLLEVFYFLLRVSDVWWLLMWVFFSLFMVLILFISPVVINPLFNKYEPLEDPSLSGRLKTLADRAGVKVVGSFVQNALSFHSLNT